MKWSQSVFVGEITQRLACNRQSLVDKREGLKRSCAATQPANDSDILLLRYNGSNIDSANEMHIAYLVDFHFFHTFTVDQ